MFFNDTATTEIYTLSLHDALPICGRVIGIELAKVVLESFLNANFLPEPRFQRRLDKLNQVEQTGLP